MNPLDFLERLFSARAAEREIAELKNQNEALKAENKALKVENLQLQQKIKELEDRLKHFSSQGGIDKIVSDYDPYKNT